eukprot:10731382-Alexandrium_andersonii.AAC.1
MRFEELSCTSSPGKLLPPDPRSTSASGARRISWLKAGIQLGCWLRLASGCWGCELRDALVSRLLTLV